MTEESYATLSWNQPPLKFKAEKAVSRAVYWFERGGFLVLTGMPRPVLGESCTTSIKDFAIFPSHPQKKKKKKNVSSSYASVNVVAQITMRAGVL